MLVSSIAKFNAMNQMNNAAFAMMQSSNAMMNNANGHTFGGEHDLSMLNKMDKKLSLDLVTNKLLYQLSYLQEKMADKHQAAECRKNGKQLSVLA